MMSESDLILDIAMNLTRIGDWVLEDYPMKVNSIRIFLKQTSEYISKLDKNSKKFQRFKDTFIRFSREYPLMESAILLTTKGNPIIAERLMTWGNILTAEASLIK